MFNPFPSISELIRRRRRRRQRRQHRPAAVAVATVALAVAAGALVPTASASGNPAAPARGGDERGRTVAGTRTVADGDRTGAMDAPTAPRKSRPDARVRTNRVQKRSALAATTVAGAVSGQGAPGAGAGRTLIVYDNTGPYAWLGEAYAIETANLVSHFSSWTAHPVGAYTAGELATYQAVIYIGSTYDEPLPVAFLDDVAAATVPVVWMYSNIWQLTARQGDFAAVRGYTWKQYDFSAVGRVTYKGTDLQRDANNGAGIMDTVIYDPTKATAIADAVRADGTTFPWGVRSGNFTYIGEIPFAYVGHDDRYIAFADLLFDVLAPQTPARRRALVRLEDVGPDADPDELRAIADYLYSRGVPFSVAVYPRYRDPKGVLNGGRPEDYTLAKRPQVVSALKYMQARGGTLLMHGYTHQYGNLANPYDGVSANDFEFFMAHVDADNYVRYDGPVPDDSAAWMNGRIDQAAKVFKQTGLGVPTIFEPPHYAASAVDYRVINDRFGKRYDRGLYFPGQFSGGAPRYDKLVGQFFPYTVRDVYGSAVVPENIGNIEPEAFNNHPTRFPADLIASAKRNLVVRDATASFFYHPYLGTEYLKQSVEGIQGLGYTFVSAESMLAG